MQLEVYKEFVI